MFSSVHCGSVLVEQSLLLTRDSKKTKKTN